MSRTFSKIESQQELLAEWLELWQLEQELRTAPEPADESLSFDLELELPSDAYAGLHSDKPYTPPAAVGLERRKLMAGDVLLLPPANIATRERPVYVALLVEQPAAAAWLAAPFSRFPLPATPGELAIRRNTLALSVLSVWNVGLLTNSLLEESWYGTKLAATDLRWALELHTRPDGPFTSALAKRLGPPLFHPLDPRHDYLEEERTIWLPEQMAAPAVNESESPLELRLAAEEIAPYGDS